MEDRQLNIGGNAAQMQAIRHRDGPAMVLAGPGSGKTFVIAQRIRYLILVHDIDPGSILTITFTKAAANEMRQRFSKLTDHRFPETVFGTFHSVFYQILRQSGRNYNDQKLNIVSESEKFHILNMILRDECRNLQDITVSQDLITSYISEISRLKSEGLGPGDAGDEIRHRELLPAVWQKYHKMLRDLDRLDFDDMIGLCLELLSSDSSALAFWQSRFRYIQIDEYQDINRSQFEVVKLLAAPDNNIFIVGDDDQSIYGFRGSRPDFMLSFENDFPGAERIMLNVNYRCRRSIIESADKVIACNVNRFEKQVSAGRPEEGEVRLLSFDEKEDEAEAMIKHLKELGDEVRNTAVIVRSNAQVEEFSRKLLASGISVSAMKKPKDPYSEKEIVDILSYLRLAGRAPAVEDFYRIMNRPLRYISRESMRGNEFSVETLEAYYRDRPSMKDTVGKFARDIRLISGMRPSLAIRYIRIQMGYDRYVKTSGEYGDVQAAVARLDGLLEESKEFQRTEAFLRAVKEKSEAFERTGTAGKQSKEGGSGGTVQIEGVHIMTMHASKGLEFDTVWLPGLNEGTIPSKKLTSSAQIEEERRLLYVAMTRARMTLIMSWITGGSSYSYVPSRLLRPLVRK